MIVHPSNKGKGNKNLPPSKERGFNLDPGWEAEPVNLLSNITFLLAAIIGMQFAESTIDNLLVYQVMSIAIFSSIAHVYVSRLTAIIDEVAIVVFVLTYIQVLLIYMLKLNWWWVGGLNTAFLIVGYLCIIKYRNLFNGAVDFVPVLIALWSAGFYIGFIYDEWTMIVSAVLGTVAVIARMADFEVSIPVGTHFLWHIFSGWLILNLLLTKFLIFPG